MRVDGIDYVLMKNEYYIMQSNVPMIKFFIKKMDYGERVNVIGCISTSVKNSLTIEQLENISFQVERKLLLTGSKQVDIIYFIYSDNIERDKIFNSGNIKFWLIDMIAGQLIIYENQPYEFDGLHQQIQDSLNKISTHSQYSNRDAVRYHRKPYGESRYQNSVKNMPFVTIFIILCNMVVFFILESMGSTENALFMLRHGAAYSKLIFEEHEYYRLFTSMFLHFGIAHLVNNMISLWFIGGEVERMYGHIEYIILYIITGLTGSMLSAVSGYMSNRVSISAGASGAVYGILGALLLLVLKYGRDGNSKLYKVVIVLFFLAMAGRTTENVDNMAHLGGFIAGVICGFLLSLFNERREHCKSE